MIGMTLAMVTILLMTAACCTPRRIRKWNDQMPIEATAIAADRVAVAEDGEERAQRRLDQHPVRHVADAAADPVAEGREETGVVAEALAGVGIDAGVDVRPALGQGLEDPRQHVHAGARDEPGDDRAQRAGGVGKGAWQGEDARPDHSADDHRGQLPSATSSVQPSWSTPPIGILV